MKTMFVVVVVLFLSCHAGFAQLTAKNIKFDAAIAGFKFAVDFQGTLVYTPNGNADLDTKDPTAFSYSIYQDATYNKAVEQIEEYMKMSTDRGYLQTDVVKKETVVNGNKAYYISYTETLPNSDYKNINFNGFFINGTTAVLFISGDTKGGMYIDKLKKTFFSTKIVFP